MINTTSINQNLFFSLKVSPYVYRLFFIDLFLIKMVLINTKSVNQNRICWNMSVKHGFEESSDPKNNYSPTEVIHYFIEMSHM